MAKITPDDLRTQDSGEAPAVVEALAPIATGKNKDGTNFYVATSDDQVNSNPAVTGTLAASNDAVAVDISSAGTFLFEIAPSASVTGTVIFEVTYDGVSWRQVQMARLDNISSSSTTLAWSNTSNAYAVMGIAPPGAQQGRVRASGAITNGTLAVRGISGAQQNPPFVGVAGTVALSGNPTLGSSTFRIGFVARSGIWYQETVSATLAAGATAAGASRDTTGQASGVAINSAAAMASDFRASAAADQPFTLRIEGSDDTTTWDTFIEVVATSKGAAGNARYTANASMPPATRYMRCSVTNTSGSAFTVARMRSYLQA